MDHILDGVITEEDLAAARAQVRKGTRGLFLGLETALGIAAGLGAAVACAIAGVGPILWLALGTAGAAMVIGSPVFANIHLLARRRGLAIAIDNMRQRRLMQVEADRRAFENELGRGLDMADDEADAFEVIRRALLQQVPDATVELLLADNSQAHLSRVVGTASPAAGPPGCSVDAPHRCAAARRAHTLVFTQGDALDACPFLRDRGSTPCAAVCVPVSIMGRTVGITHAVRRAEQGFTDAEIQALQAIANQSGNRLGMLRIMSETQLQASTDGLTGLINRRSFENTARQLRTAGTDFVVVLADLDHFKELNDTYGHETGDRALRLFAQVLRDELREDDVACRYGGEEFVLLLPRSDLTDAVSVLERVRAALVEAAVRNGVPPFTASFGVAQSADAIDLEDLVRRADLALFAAKDAGRDCICIDGHRQPVSSHSAFS